MVCPLAGWSVRGSGWLLHLPHPWLFQEWLHFTEWPQEVVLHLFSWAASFALFSLESGTRLYLIAATIGLGWKDLLVKGVVMICPCLMNSTIFFFIDG